MHKDKDEQPVRIDKWLWAARFFKTRSIATDAIDGGHVHLNGDRVKPARALKVGDRLRIRTLGDEFEVVVEALSDRRGPASVAQTLYRETDESLQARERRREEEALAPQFDHPAARGRPTKKWRRQLHRFERSNQD
ncbi:RNA-binding S4 domain-containing protein [Chitinimonas lacunae]|uniref:RNA-binding S4 domain-containing protein n=1 Tax=Chitinimonas lacunae TaxID=1963018 RepID=A0ABV8ML24_9NEIS